MARHKSNGVNGFPRKETCQNCGATREWWGHKPSGPWNPGPYCYPTKEAPNAR